jgi:hypothetical protein
MDANQNQLLEPIMPSMIEMLLNSGNTSPLSQLGSKFGISEDQVRQAVEALAPALSIGMKRNVASPMGAGSFIEALSSGRHEQYADQPDLALSDDGVIEGNKILGHVLGSKDVSRAVALQASQATGMGQSTLKQILPVIASMIMGSMFKGAKQGAAGGSGGILGQILNSVLGGGASKTYALQRRASDGENPIGRMFEDMLAGQGNKNSSPGKRRTTDEGALGEVFEDLLGRGSRSNKNKPASASSDDNPLGDLLDGFLNGDDDQEPQIEAGGQRRKTPSGGNLTDIFGDMFETGRKSDDPYQNDMESIFNDFLKK